MCVKHLVHRKFWTNSTSIFTIMNLIKTNLERCCWKGGAGQDEAWPQVIEIPSSASRAYGVM